MSETPQLEPDVSQKPGPPQSDVSRETHQAGETPEQAMLSEILARSKLKSPGPQEGEPGSEAPREEPASPPEKGVPPSPPRKNKSSSFYVYLVILFGAAFMMLLLAYFIQRRNNETAMSELRSTMNLSREDLMEQIETLEKENAQLQADLEGQTGRAGQAEQENERLSQELSDSYTLCGQEAMKAQAAACLWYLDQFMQAKDYPMAAAVLYFSVNNYRSLFRNNPAQLGQCEKYRQELIDRGYFQEVPSTLNGQLSSICFTQQWDPSQSEDMAAMCILWTALDAYFINGAYESAAQFLYLNPLADPATGYQDRLERLASDFTLRQFQDLKDALVEAGTLAVAEDGAMTQGPGDHFDVLYGLPFELPTKTFTQIPLN